jgi:hypothetical protein
VGWVKVVALCLTLWKAKAKKTLPRMNTDDTNQKKQEQHLETQRNGGSGGKTGRIGAIMRES